MHTAGIVVVFAAVVSEMLLTLTVPFPLQKDASVYSEQLGPMPVVLPKQTHEPSACAFPLPWQVVASVYSLQVGPVPDYMSV